MKKFLLHNVSFLVFYFNFKNFKLFQKSEKLKKNCRVFEKMLISYLKIKI